MYVYLYRYIYTVYVHRTSNTYNKYYISMMNNKLLNRNLILPYVVFKIDFSFNSNNKRIDKFSFARLIAEKKECCMIYLQLCFARHFLQSEISFRQSYLTRLIKCIEKYDDTMSHIVGS